MGESKSRIEPVTCPDCGVRGEVRLAQSGFKNNFPNVVQCKHRQGMAVVTCPSLRPEIDAAHKNTAKASKTHQRASLSQHGSVWCRCRISAKPESQ